MNDSAVPSQSGATGQGSPEQQVEIAVGDVFAEHRPASYGRTGGTLRVQEQLEFLVDFYCRWVLERSHQRGVVTLSEYL